MKYLETGFSRQPHVENDEVVRFGVGAALAVLSVGDEIHGPTMFFETALHVLSDGRIVFNDEDSHAAQVDIREYSSRVGPPNRGRRRHITKWRPMTGRRPISFVRMERKGLEPLTPALQRRCSPS